MKFKIPFVFLTLSNAHFSWAQNVDAVVQTFEPITILASPSLTTNLSNPVVTISGAELRNKLGVSLGETLSGELGMSATGFGAAASRPIIRGMEGSRVQILENGLNSGDVSSVSNDHSIANDLAQTKSIEILRGANALKYGSGSGSGIINILNSKILTEKPEQLNANIDSKLTSADHGQSNAFEINTSLSDLALHIDAAKSIANDYAIPGYRELGGPGGRWPGMGNSYEQYKLPFSYSFSDNLGFGLSLIHPNGYTGISLEQSNHQYGIPSLEGSQIKLKQDKVVLQHLTTNPIPGIESVSFKISSTQYGHTELSTNWLPSTQFNNQSYDSRIEFTHEKIASWNGVFGFSVSKGQLSAFDLLNNNLAAIVPPTNNLTWSAFLVEERKWTSLSTDLGLRFERAKRLPNSLIPYSDSPLATNSLFSSSQSFETPIVKNKTFDTLSWSTGMQYPYDDQYSTALHYSIAQRAPASQELYSYGAHDATATFDIGQSNLIPETAHNFELNLMKSKGQLRWKSNFFYNKIEKFIYGALSGTQDLQNGFDIRQFNQADVIQKGLEAEVAFGNSANGSNFRVFTDYVKTQFMNGLYTPLQAPTRLGIDWSYREGLMRSSLTAIHAYQQNHLAVGEIAPTPAYTDLRATWSYHQSLQNSDLDWYILAKNLLNQDIRYSTTVQTLRLYAPQAGKSITLGVKWNM